MQEPFSLVAAAQSELSYVFRNIFLSCTTLGCQVGTAILEGFLRLKRYPFMLEIRMRVGQVRILD